MSNSSNSTEYISVKLVGGGQVVTAVKNVVGYCHFAEHRGAITRTILKNRECAKKECHYFERCKDNTYWIAYDQMHAAQQQKKESRKRMLQEMKKQQMHYTEIAQRIADDLGYDIKVMEVKKTEQNDYILYYISENDYNDWYLYFDLAKNYEKTVGGRVELKHIKDMNGNYAII